MSFLNKWNLFLWSKGKTHLFVSDEKFLGWVWWALAKLKWTLGFYSFYAQVLSEISDNDFKQKRRPWLFFLGSSWLVGISHLFLLVLFLSLTSHWGFWIWLWSGAQELTPPFWMLSLGDTSISFLLILSLIGFLFGMARINFFIISFITLALFAGIISTWGGLVLFFAARLGEWANLYTPVKKYSPYLTDWGVRSGLALFFYLCVLFLGGFSVMLIRELIGFTHFASWGKVFEWGLVIGWWTCLETLISLCFFHYYWKCKNES